MTETIKLDKNTFLRGFKVLANQSYDLFLGAGASVSSGIPSGRDLVWHFKREIFCLERDIHPSKFRDLQIESNRKLIQSFFDERGDNDIDNPYSHYFEECYPDPLVRKEFLTNRVRDKKPSIGFLCLAALVESKKLNVVWTTNFDDLIEKAVNSLNFTSCSIISPENASSVSGYKDDIPKVVKLHGDFRYDPLQNTGEELQKLEENLQEYIVKGSEERGLIIVAYSGSDQSIMETLQKAIKNPFAFPKGLIWCIPKGIKPSEELIQLIDEANKQNERSGFIEIDSFDFFLHKLYKVCDLQNEQIDSISKERFELRQAFRISQTTSQTTPILLNGIKACSFPKTIYSATTDLEGWSELRRLLQEKRIVGALYKGKTLLWGNEDDINNTFKGRIKDELKVVDIPEKFFYYSDSIYLGLLYDLVEKTFVEDYSLKIFARGKSIRKIFSNKHSLSNDEISNIKKWNRTFFVPSDIRIYEAFEFKIELINKSLFFLICPTIHIEKQDGKEAERRQNQYLSNIILSNRYNNLYSGKLSFWLKILKEITL
ncbi:MAG: SIR2 family protein [Candidatus Scalindua rubra]|uniref:Uncharacterized protein n=1 Tax=Candidatus Scalindua brodae TaxID=237368 RepID=A0A0B0ELC2_9BACT|nr:MAG: hypothetical protein SCABRO_00805 [Candidatus Scalindua brodae]MBZ0108191.1 SIR2 family protein [Candidatus Scalindua rubra]TWU31293.1 hypothetical protein S225a_22390 [Candidatus Brocadiaceae bacterium S225]